MCHQCGTPGYLHLLQAEHWKRVDQRWAAARGASGGYSVYSLERGKKWKKKNSKKRRKGRGISRRMRKKKIEKGTWGRERCTASHRWYPWFGTPATCTGQASSDTGNSFGRQSWYSRSLCPYSKYFSLFSCGGVECLSDGYFCLAANFCIDVLILCFFSTQTNSREGERTINLTICENK